MAKKNEGYTTPKMKGDNQPFSVWGAVQKLWKKRADTGVNAPGGKKRKK